MSYPHQECLILSFINLRSEIAAVYMSNRLITPIHGANCKCTGSHYPLSEVSHNGSQILSFSQRNTKVHKFIMSPKLNEIGIQRYLEFHTLPWDYYRICGQFIHLQLECNLCPPELSAFATELSGLRSSWSRVSYWLTNSLFCQRNTQFHNLTLSAIGMESGYTVIGIIYYPMGLIANIPHVFCSLLESYVYQGQCLFATNAPYIIVHAL